MRIENSLSFLRIRLITSFVESKQMKMNDLRCSLCTFLFVLSQSVASKVALFFQRQTFQETRIIWWQMMARPE